MNKINVREAKNHINRYENVAHAGETITVCKNGEPWFDFTPHASSTPRPTRPMDEARPVNTATKVIAPVDENDLGEWI